MNNNFSAMILAAGYGKRMLPLTNEIPKPLIKVNNVSLLKNNIDFLLKLGCKNIVINTHYKHELILKFINKFYNSSNIIISYEKMILDTAGGVKNAINLFNNKRIIVTNCDIFWTKKNEQDVKNLIFNFETFDQCRLLLVDMDKANGINKNDGDFYFENKLVKRWEPGNKKFIYSGLQMLDLEILNRFEDKKFSFNKVWDFLIKNDSLYANIMYSNLYHVGDLNGLKTANNSLG